jgi:hypothetical protein
MKLKDFSMQILRSDVAGAIIDKEYIYKDISSFATQALAIR